MRYIKHIVAGFMLMIATDAAPIAKGTVLGENQKKLLLNRIFRENNGSIEDVGFRSEGYCLYFTPIKGGIEYSITEDEAKQLIVLFDKYKLGEKSATIAIKNPSTATQANIGVGVNSDQKILLFMSESAVLQRR